MKYVSRKDVFGLSDAYGGWIEFALNKIRVLVAEDKEKLTSPSDAELENCIRVSVVHQEALVEAKKDLKLLKEMYEKNEHAGLLVNNDDSVEMM